MTDVVVTAEKVLTSEEAVAFWRTCYPGFDDLSESAFRHIDGDAGRAAIAEHDAMALARLVEPVLRQDWENHTLAGIIGLPPEGARVLLIGDFLLVAQFHNGSLTGAIVMDTPAAMSLGDEVIAAIWGDEIAGLVVGSREGASDTVAGKAVLAKSEAIRVAAHAFAAEHGFEF